MFYNIYFITDLERNNEFTRSPNIPCTKLRPRITWYSNVPSGYLYNDQWISLLCSTNLPLIDKNSYVDIFTKWSKGKHLIFLGDSVGRQMYVHIVNFFKLYQVSGPKYDKPQKNSTYPWQAPRKAELLTNGFRAEYKPHEHPFAGTPGSPKDMVRSVKFYLDQMTAKRKTIIVINWFLHIARCCSVDIFREHARNAIRGILNLLARVPEVKLFIKGPHAATYAGYLIPYDFVRRYIDQVLFEEFFHLQDRVIYLETWGVTLGAMETNVHPSEFTVKLMVHNLLSFLIGTYFDV